MNPWPATLAVMLATFMEVLDTTVVNVSLSHIAGSLSATPNEATWALTSYLVANGIVIPISGWLAGRLGRKNLLLLSTAGFTAASLLCGMAPNLPLLIVFRVLQGACGGSLQPVSQAVLLEAFPQEQHGKAMGVWALGVVVAPVIGPVLGGWLTDNFSWRWIFYINLPAGLASLLLTQLFISDPPYLRRASAPVDLWGLGVLAAWVAALQIVLDKGQELDWFSSRFIVFLAVVCVLGLVSWVWRELTTRDPITDLRVFKDRTFAVGAALMFATGFTLYGSQVAIALWLQTLLGYPAMQAGVAMMAIGMGSVLSMPLVGFLVSKFDARKLFVIGILGFVGSLWKLMHFNLNIGYWDIFWPQFMQGLSMGFLFVPLMVLTMGFIPKERTGNATSLFNMMRNIGGGIGISIVATMQTRLTQRHINLLGANITHFHFAATRWINGLHGFLARAGSGFPDQKSFAVLFGLVGREAAMVALVRVFQFLGILLVGLLPLVFLMKRPSKRASGEFPAALDESRLKTR